MTLVLEHPPKIIAQHYQCKNKSIFQSIQINASTRISEMVERNEKRILTNRNRWVRDRTNCQYPLRTDMNTTTQIGKSTPWLSCPVHYTKVICSGCFHAIEMHNLYLAKNSRFRAKFYHVSCADRKNVI